MEIQENIGGVVLAGGLSTRMGKDKAFLLDHDGKSFLQKNIQLLQSMCKQVWVSCRQDAPLIDYPCVYDIYENIGPLGGIYSSLEHAYKHGLAAILVIACDMPSLNEQVLKRLIDARNYTVNKEKSQNLPQNDLCRVTAYYQEEKQFFQGLCAIWEVHSRAQLHMDMTGKFQERRLWHIVPPQCQNRVMYKEYEWGSAFDNLNTPQEVTEYLKLFHK